MATGINCCGGPPPPPPPPPPASPTVDLRVNGSNTPAAVSPGTSVTVSWNTTNVAACAAAGLWGGSRGTSGSVSITVNASGQFLIDCWNTAGTTVRDTVNITAIASPTVDLRVNGSNTPAAVPPGTSVTVSWNTTNAAACAAAGLWGGSRATSGNATITVNAGGSFIIDCWNTAGTTVRDTVNISTSVANPTVDLRINNSNGPILVPLNSSVTASWTTTNASQCWATGQSIWANPYYKSRPSGSQNVGPITGSGPFVLTCNNSAGVTVSDTVNLNVSVPAPTLTFTADSTNIAYNGSTTLRWSTTNATSCTASGAWSGSKTVPSGNQSTGSLTTSRTFTLSCSGAGGSTTRSVTVNVAGAPPPPATPTLTFTADSTNLAYNGSTTLRWDSTNATSCTASGAWSGSKSVDGSQSTGNLTSSRTYTLVCTGAGGSITRSVAINVAGSVSAPSVNLTADSTNLSYNGSTTLRWSTSNATSCTASGAWTGSKAVPSGNQSTGSLTTSRSYTLTCTGPGGSASDSVTINVGSLPPPSAPSVNLTADSTSLAYNGSTTLRWNSVNATSCTASGDWSGSKAVPSGNQSTGNLTTTQNYTLTCTGPGGSNTDSVRVSVASNNGPAVSITSPGNGSRYVTGTNVNISATATDTDGYITQVEFFDNGTRIGTDTSAPYSASISSIGTGSHTIIARATDNIGATDSDTISISADPPPSCTLTLSPGSLIFDYGQSRSVTGTTTAVSGTIDQVTFSTLDPSIFSITPPATDYSAPYSAILTSQPPSQAPGDGTLAAQAIMNTGTRCSAVADVTVNSVACQAPTNLASLYNNADDCAQTPTSNGSIVFSWDSVPFATEYDVDILDSSNAVVRSNSFRPASSFGCGSGGRCSYSVQLTPGSYTARIQPQGTLCDADATNRVTTNPPVTINVCDYDISGNVYLDREGMASLNGNNCELAGSLTGVKPGDGSRVSASTYGSDIGGDGSFSLQVPGSDDVYFTRLSNYDTANFIPTCPASGMYSISAPPGQTGVNFFVTDSMEPWYQLIGGDAHANAPGLDALSAAFLDPIPFTCALSPGCSPVPFLRREASAQDTSGILTFASGVIDISQRSGIQAPDGTNYLLSQETPSLSAQTSIPDRDQFNRFVRLFELPLSPATDPFPSGIPTNPPVNGTNPDHSAYYHTGDQTINSPWAVASNQTLIIFIDGNLTVSESISVDPGGFLAFIVTGNFTFSPNVGQADAASLDAVVEGVFIADGQIIIQSDGDNDLPDLKFVGEGSFIGWSGVSLDRDYENNLNNQNPTELFRFRPDFVINAPEAMKSSYYVWQELAP